MINGIYLIVVGCVVRAYNQTCHIAAMRTVVRWAHSPMQVILSLRESRGTRGALPHISLSPATRQEDICSKDYENKNTEF
jgi:hypothetical protein